MSLKTCILHVGMPKTGTSSIQDSLWSNLKDPRFHYVDLTGHPNGSEFMNLAFMDDPLEYWLYRKLGYSRARLSWLKRRYQAKLRRQLCRVYKANQTAIISAEVCWRFKPSELEAIREFMRDVGFELCVIAYLRPMKSWLESNIQQNLKFGSDITTIDRIGDEQCMVYLRYSQRLKTFESIFGKANLVVRAFTSEGLIAGCVVSDFCQALGIRFAPKSILRANESMAGDTVRMLYCFNKFLRTSSYPSLASNQLMLKHLSELKGENFHLHSRFFLHMVDHIQSENDLLLSRYGIHLHEDLARHDDGPCIHTLADMMCFSRESLDWLAAKSQQQKLEACEGLATAQIVARQMSFLLCKPIVALWMQEVRVRLQHRIHVLIP
ncbi:MAG: hypothetical protein RLZZ117_2631 [Cyanobacteriota bacterium]